MDAIAQSGLDDDPRALLPPPPREVPSDLTLPNAAFRRSAWIATIGLLGFVAVYLGLVGYFGWFVVHFGFSGSVQGVLIAIPAAFFCAFLVRGLFVVKHAEDPASIEVTAAEQPKLFAYLHELADSVSAPRPHRVFVSARVNAAVFYDLSFRNLILPSKKNLEIGLGLVEALSLDEMKGVVAHEFGHFAQKTMAVGRWVYVARQIASHIIAARTGFDDVLAFVSRIDLRVAWIGWIMRLFVWAIRAILDSFFRLVVLAHRALGRNMEFQADRVAVSVSGSDSLIHALHRLGPADEAWDAAIAFALEERSNGRPVADLFALEGAMIEHLRRVFDDPAFGATPSSEKLGTPDHRVFQTKFASPPRMWDTHPSSRDREDHAKASYLPSTLDPRSAWALFTDAPALREKVTRAFFAPRPMPERKKGKAQVAAPPDEKPPVPIAETLARLDERYRRASLDPRYRGAYLGRSIAGFHRSSAAMIAAERSSDRDEIRRRIGALYPDSLRQLLLQYREYREEEALLEGLAAGILTAPGGVVRHRGREIRRKELPNVVAEVKLEREATEKSLMAHDAACRAAYLDAATELGQGWAPYLSHLTRLLHYAAQGARSLRDEHTHLHHVLDIVFADGSVSSAERVRVRQAASFLHTEIVLAWDAHAKIRLPAAVAARFEGRGGYKVLTQQLRLGAPSDANLGDWLQVVDGWAGEAAADLDILAQATLDVLLEAETHVDDHHAAGTDPGPAPEQGAIPAEYPVCVVGDERPRQKRLGLWDRFQTADGILPGIARFGVASAMVAPAFLFAGDLGVATIHAYNGLAIPVDVTVDGIARRVPSHAFSTFEHEGSDPVRIVTTTPTGGRIEAFETDADEAFGTYVYNVANAAVFSHWTATYGSASRTDDDRVIGAPRFVEAEEDYVLVEPPRSISSSGDGGRKTVFEAFSFDDMDPTAQADTVSDAAERSSLIASHLRFDPVDSAAFEGWLLAAPAGSPSFTVGMERVQSQPFSVDLQRALDDRLDDAERDAACVRRTADSAANPDDVGRLYLAIRCMDDPSARDAAFAAARARYPADPYLAYGEAMSFASRGLWVESMQAWTLALAGIRSADWRDAAALESLRTHRAAIHAAADGVGPFYEPPEGTRGSGYARLVAIESAAPGDVSPGVDLFRKLRDGDVAGVASFLAEHGVDSPHFRVLLGASDGASAAAVASATSVEPRGLPSELLLYVAGLLARQGQDTASLEPALVIALHADGTTPIAGELLTALRAKDAAALEALASTPGVRLRLRAGILAAGLIAMGERAPSAWRDEVKATSFAFERPYFGP